MSLIIAENVGQHYGAQEVLRDVSFRVAEGDRIALVGANGEGKTTLLRIVAGEIDSTLGAVHRRRALRVGYLAQEPPALGDKTVYGAMLDVFAEVRRMEEELHEISSQLGGHPDPKLLARYGELQARFESAGGYGYTRRIERVLEGLAFERDSWQQTLSTLSGGQRTRAYLAGILLSEPELLLLDEPTNHLDIDSVEWLEGWLGEFKGAIVVVSHDRWFLDRVTTATWEVGACVLETYPAPYTQYLELKAKRHLELRRRWEQQQEHIDKTQDFIRRHIAGQRTKEARGRRKRLERFIEEEAVERPRDSDAIHLSLGSADRSGNVVLSADNLAVGYEPGRPLVSAERLLIVRGQRVAVVGANGIGKTTLLRTFLGELEPLAGSVKLGAKVSVGYLSQTHAELDPDATAIESVMRAGEGLTEEVVRTLLGSLLLSGDDAFKKISELSGGQRSRIILARLVVQSDNVLMLDEPTNHLDVPSTEIIQDVLRRFDGTVLFITHDRRLIEAVATDVWAVEDGRVFTIHGGWESFVHWRDARRRHAAEVSDAGSGDARRAEHEESRRQANLLQRLRRRHEELETEITATEQRLAAINDELASASAAGDMTRIETLGLEYNEKQARLKDLWAEWEEVGGKLE